MKSSFCILKIVGVLSLGLSVSCQSDNKANTASPVWLGNMHKLSIASEALVPSMNDPQSFRKSEIRPFLAENLLRQKEAAEGILNENKAPDADPIIRFLSQEFLEQTNRTIIAFEKNDWPSTKFYVNRSLGYCIACHSRGDRGIQDNVLRWSFQTDKLTSLQKTEYYFANRIYKKGIEEAYLTAQQEEKAKNESAEWMIAMKRSLAITVRVWRSPSETLQLLRAMAANKGVSPGMKAELDQWIKDISYWSTTKHLAPDSFFPSNMSLRKLVEWSKVRSDLPDQKYFIRWLMATAEMNDRLEKGPASDKAANYYYAGVLATGLSDLNMGVLDEYYFEQCIREEPHTDLALKCFKRYSKSQGSMMIINESPLRNQKLRELEELARKDPSKFKTPKVNDVFDFLGF